MTVDFLFRADEFVDIVILTGIVVMQSKMTRAIDMKVGTRPETPGRRPRRLRVLAPGLYIIWCPKYSILLQIAVNILFLYISTSE